MFCEICKSEFITSRNLFTPYKTFCGDKCFIESKIKTEGECWIKKGVIRRDFVWNAYQKGPIPEQHQIQTSCNHHECLNPDHLIIVSKKELRIKLKEKRKLIKERRLQERQRKVEEGIRNCWICKKEHKPMTLANGEKEIVCSLRCALIGSCRGREWGLHEGACWILSFPNNSISYNDEKFSPLGAAQLLKYRKITDHQEFCPKDKDCVNPIHIKKCSPIEEFIQDFNEYELKVFLNKYRSELLSIMVSSIITGNFKVAEAMREKIRETHSYNNIE